MSLTDTPADLVGPARIALNHSGASIHDPEEAKRLGFRGSAVGGNLHLDIFAPLLVETYGQAWFERGALSRRYGKPGPFLVMTSPATDSDTRDYFREHRFFGLHERDVIFFRQGTMPAVCSRPHCGPSTRPSSPTPPGSTPSASSTGRRPAGT